MTLVFVTIRDVRRRRMSNALVALAVRVVEDADGDMELTKFGAALYAAEPASRAQIKAAGGVKSWLAGVDHVLNLYRPRPQDKPTVYHVRHATNVGQPPTPPENPQRNHSITPQTAAPAPEPPLPSHSTPSATAPQAVARATPLVVFQTCRVAATANGTQFLDWNHLVSHLHQRLGTHPMSPRSDVREYLHALQRVLQEVSSAIDAVIATHHVVSLHELEQLVLSTSDAFKERASFGELMLGPFQCHPKLRQHFKPAALAASPPPAVKGCEVMQYVAEQLEASWDAQEGKAERLDVKQVLLAFAEERGFASIDEMGVLVRSQNFVTGIVARCLAARRRAEKSAERALESERTKYLRLRQRDAEMRLEAERREEAAALDAEISARREQRRLLEHAWLHLGREQVVFGEHLKDGNLRTRDASRDAVGIAAGIAAGIAVGIAAALAPRPRRSRALATRACCLSARFVAFW